MKTLLALLASCLSLSAAFPVFFGNQNNYISNDVTVGIWHVFIEGERVAVFNTNGITLTNNNGILIAKTNNSTTSIIQVDVRGVQVYRLTVSSNVFTIVDAINNDAVLQYDLSKRILNIANSAVSIRTDSLISTNFGSAIFHQDITSAGYAKTIQTITGTGGANTNFTLQSTQAMVFIDVGKTNASLIIMGGETTRAWEGALVGTNRTGTDRTFAFNALSNSWQSVTHYDGVSTNGETLTVTNNTGVAIWWRLVGSNVLYAAKHITLPAPP